MYVMWVGVGGVGGGGVPPVALLPRLPPAHHVRHLCAGERGAGLRGSWGREDCVELVCASFTATTWTPSRWHSCGRTRWEPLWVWCVAEPCMAEPCRLRSAFPDCRAVHAACTAAPAQHAGHGGGAVQDPGGGPPGGAQQAVGHCGQQPRAAAGAAVMAACRVHTAGGGGGAPAGLRRPGFCGCCACCGGIGT